LAQYPVNEFVKALDHFLTLFAFGIGLGLVGMQGRSDGSYENAMSEHADELSWESRPSRQRGSCLLQFDGESVSLGAGKFQFLGETTGKVIEEVLVLGACLG